MAFLHFMALFLLLALVQVAIMLRVLCPRRAHEFAMQLRAVPRT